MAGKKDGPVVAIRSRTNPFPGALARCQNAGISTRPSSFAYKSTGEDQIVSLTIEMIVLAAGR